MKTQKKLVIIGAGYAGINIVKKLSNNTDIKITLINKSAYHLHQTDIHKYISGECSFEEVSFSLQEFAVNNNIDFIEGCVTDVDFDSKKVLLDRTEISYDYLTIATGSVSFFPRQIKNIEAYAQDIKDISVLKAQREKFLSIINGKEKNKNIAIVGGGLSGVEIALEFANVLKQKNIQEDECTISIIEQLPTVLPNMNPFLVDNTIAACNALNIKQYHGAFVNEVKDDTVFLSDDRKIPFDMIVLVIGVTSEKLVKKEEVNVKNQFIVDEYLRLENHKEVFVVGDIAQTKDKNDNYVLPTAQMAKLHATLTAKNIVNSINSKTLIKNECETKGIMVDLANKNAVGLLMGLKVKGFIAYFLKRYVSKQHINLFK